MGATSPAWGKPEDADVEGAVTSAPPAGVADTDDAPGIAVAVTAGSATAATAADSVDPAALLLPGARTAVVAVSESIAAETRDWKVQDSTCPLAAASKNRP